MGDFTKEFEKGLASHTAQLDPLIKGFQGIPDDLARLKIKLDGLEDRDIGCWLNKVGTKVGSKRLSGNELRELIRRTSASILEYVEGKKKECPDEEKEELQEVIKKHIDGIKKKYVVPKGGHGVEWENKKYLGDFFYELMDRISQILMYEPQHHKGNKPPSAYVWGGMKWRVVPAGYWKAVSGAPARPRRPKDPKEGDGASHCNGWNHKPGCCCGWGGPGRKRKRKKRVSPRTPPATVA